MDNRFEGRLLLRPVEAAEVLGVGRSKLYELLAQRALPTVFIGRRRRVPIEALQRWIARQLEQQPESLPRQPQR